MEKVEGWVKLQVTKVAKVAEITPLMKVTKVAKLAEITPLIPRMPLRSLSIFASRDGLCQSGMQIWW